MFVWNSAVVVHIAATFWTGRLASGLAGILSVIDLSDIIRSFDYDKSSSI